MSAIIRIRKIEDEEVIPNYNKNIYKYEIMKRNFAEFTKTELKEFLHDKKLCV